MRCFFLILVLDCFFKFFLHYPFLLPIIPVLKIDFLDSLLPIILAALFLSKRNLSDDFGYEVVLAQQKSRLELMNTILGDFDSFFNAQFLLIYPIIFSKFPDLFVEIIKQPKQEICGIATRIQKTLLEKAKIKYPCAPLVTLCRVPK